MLNFIIFVISAAFALAFFYRLIALDVEKRTIRFYSSRRNIFLLFRVGLIVALGMALMMMCFAFMLSVALQKAEYLEIVSIAFIISFLASLPVSFGGWGLREVSSMFFVAHLGGVAEAGLAASLLIGLISMVVVLMCYPILLVGRESGK